MMDGKERRAMSRARTFAGPLAGWVTMALLAAAAQAHPPVEPQRTIPAEALKADLRVLWDILAEGHGALDRYTPEDTLEKTFDATRSGLTGPLTPVEFCARLLPLVAGIKDGHTRLALSEDDEKAIEARPIFIPFAPRFLVDKAYVLRDLSPERSVGDGAELLAIDGRPAAEVVSALLPLIPVDAGIRTAKLRSLESPGAFGRLLALRFGGRASYRVRFRAFRSAAIKEAVVPGITEADLFRLLRERAPAARERRPSYELGFEGGTAVLAIRQFADDQDKARPRFAEFLSAAFAELEARKTPGLVIDLRGNGGGFDEYGKLLFAHVMDRPFLYYWKMETKKDRYDLFRYAEGAPKTAEELARALRPNAEGRFDVIGHPNSGLQSTRKPRFLGRVEILIDGGSRSTTGEVVSAFHYYKKAAFFGEEGGAGYYGTTTYLVTATLPASRIRITLPLVMCVMAVEGYAKDRGLAPDFPVAPTIEDLMAGRDPVMERALAYVRKKP
jgi:hypothetical protein